MGDATVLKAIEGRVELTDTAVVFRGINRWEREVTVPLRSISAIDVFPGNFGKAAVLTVITDSGDRISRRCGPRGRQAVPEFAAAIRAAMI